MKEPITKFDLEAAFTALDSLDIPTAKHIKANKPDLTEIFSRKSKFESLFEDYYDISSSEGLEDAKEAREAEVAKAKLARIEKIVDLDAKSPDDLLTSYVGKFIIQCPQCMTLFYKNPEDIEESEDDPETVNVNETCQHCGNNSGYTLIGKVGAAEEPDLEAETPAETSEDSEKPDETELTPTEDAESAETSTNEEDIDFGDLDDLDLNIEEDKEEETEEAKESLEPQHNINLNEELDDSEENLNEATTDLSVSDQEFEKLIKSPEFKKPISDVATRVMLKDLSETVNNENPESSEVSEAEDEKTESNEAALEEGIFDDFKSKAKDRLEAFIDKLDDKIKSREDKANWILKASMKDYSKVTVDNDELKPDELDNRRFRFFAVIGYGPKYINDKAISEAPSFNNTDLVMSMEKPQYKETYEEADKIAKGWSMQSENGPAFIYLAASENDTKPVFLCEYFKGNLYQDQVENYFKVVKDNIKGAKLRKEGGEEPTEKAKETRIEASKAEAGMKVKVGKDIGEITEVANSSLGNDIVDLKLLINGTERTLSIGNTTMLTLATVAEAFSLPAFMDSLENLQESSLESLIADSLTESYKNVAGFKIKDCSYLNEAFDIEGTIYFVSGNTRATTFKITEAFKDGQQTILKGLNEKLTKKEFSLQGTIDDTKTFITESFKLDK